MIAIERLSPSDIRASSQALLLFFTNGLGMFVGHIVSGQLHDYFAYPDIVLPDGGLAIGGHAWSKIFLLPIILTIIAAILFFILFNERKYQEDAETIENDTDTSN